LKDLRQPGGFKTISMHISGLLDISMRLELLEYFNLVLDEP
jgi:hypothetical protein